MLYSCTHMATVGFKGLLRYNVEMFMIFIHDGIFKYCVASRDFSAGRSFHTQAVAIVMVHVNE